MNIETWQDQIDRTFKMRCLDCGEVATITEAELAAGPRDLIRPENFSHVCKNKLLGNEGLTPTVCSDSISKT